MIFLTVGTQVPFDRLVKAVDLWAGEKNYSDIFGQVGDSQYIPKNIAWKKRLTIDEYEQYVSNADVVVSHLGMGTVITCAKFNAPLVAMPRKYDLHEHRNNHQMESARLFKKHHSIKVIYENEELMHCLSNFNNIFCKDIFDYDGSEKRLNIIRRVKRFIESS